MSANVAQSNPMVGRPPRDLDLSRVRELLSNMSVLQAARVLGIHRNTIYYHLSHEPRIEARRAAVKDKLIALRRAKVRRDARRAARLAKRQTSVAYRETYRELLLALFLVHANGIFKSYLTERACNRCAKVKPLSAFYFKKEVGLYRTTCIECCRVRQLAIWHERGKFNRPSRARTSNPLSEFYPYRLSNEIEGADLIATINRLVPRHLPEDLRADVCQQLALSVLTGEIAAADLAEQVKLFIKGQRKFMPRRHELSLDAPFKDGSTYCLLDTLTTEDTLGRWTSKSFYGDALADCEDAGDLAERLRDAWEANRLTEPRRKTYGIHTADHRTDSRASATAPLSSGRVGMYRNVRQYRRLPPHRLGVERKLDALAWAVEDYREARRAEELAELTP